IYWTITENYPDTYLIIYNFVNDTDKIWQSDDIIPLTIDGLPEGFHNYTIVLYDVSGNFAINTIIIEVSDFVAPSILNPTSGFILEILEGESKSLFLLFTDDNPGSFNITGRKDGIIVFPFSQPNWISNTLYSVPITGLEKGIYEFTIIVLDTAGNPNILIISIIVSDKTAPKFQFEPFPTTFNYTEGEVNNVLTWTMTDKWEGHWELYQNGSELNWADYSSENNNNWFSDVPEQIRLDGFASGYYNITFVIFDASNNNASSSIILAVFDETIPFINSRSSIIGYNESTTGNILIWNIMDIHAGIYNITLDGENYDSRNWSNNIDITINIDGLEAGPHTFVIIFYDLSGNNKTDSVNID
ncbi:hypothetical protein LCGC14_3033480, partial [marine sediment metagenome]